MASTAAHLERLPVDGDGPIASRLLRLRVPSGGAATHHLYVHDGQNLFGPGGPFGSWRLEEALGPETLAIGIDNTEARFFEYTHVPDRISGREEGGGGDLYAAWVDGPVRTAVEARHGVPARRGVMGSSLGGLISFHEALLQDGRWDYAASLSGTFGWGSIGATNETLIERWAAAGLRPTVLYLDSGGGPGAGCADGDGDGIEDDGPDASDNYCETRQLADVLDGAGYTFDADLFHWWEPDAPHSEPAWAARVFRPVGIFERL